VQAAAHHRTAGQRLSARAAFTAHTRGGHRAAGRTDRGIGTISVGAAAHLAVVRAGELVRPGADPRVQRWSTDPRSRVPLLPDLTPATSFGAVAIAAYARRAGLDVQTFAASRGPALATAQVGDAIVELIVSPDSRGAYTIGAGGLSPIP
jgi:hypothetical protein